MWSKWFGRKSDDSSSPLVRDQLSRSSTGMFTSSRKTGATTSGRFGTRPPDEPDLESGAPRVSSSSRISSDMGTSSRRHSLSSQEPYIPGQHCDSTPTLRPSIGGGQQPPVIPSPASFLHPLLSGAAVGPPPRPGGQAPRKGIPPKHTAPSAYPQQGSSSAVDMNQLPGTGISNPPLLQVTHQRQWQDRAPPPPGMFANAGRQSDPADPRLRKTYALDAGATLPLFRRSSTTLPSTINTNFAPHARQSCDPAQPAHSQFPGPPNNQFSAPPPPPAPSIPSALSFFTQQPPDTVQAYEGSFFDNLVQSPPTSPPVSAFTPTPLQVHPHHSTHAPQPQQPLSSWPADSRNTSQEQSQICHSGATAATSDEPLILYPTTTPPRSSSSTTQSSFNHQQCGVSTEQYTYPCNSTTFTSSSTISDTSHSSPPATFLACSAPRSSTVQAADDSKTLMHTPAEHPTSQRLSDNTAIVTCDLSDPGTPRQRQSGTAFMSHNTGSPLKAFVPLPTPCPSAWDTQPSSQGKAGLHHTTPPSSSHTHQAPSTRLSFSSVRSSSGLTPSVEATVSASEYHVSDFAPSLPHQSPQPGRAYSAPTPQPIPTPFAASSSEDICLQQHHHHQQLLQQQQQQQQQQLQQQQQRHKDQFAEQSWFALGGQCADTSARPGIPLYLGRSASAVQPSAPPAFVPLSRIQTQAGGSFGVPGQLPLIVNFKDLALNHQIGEGGFGKVYEGQLLGHVVAIKLANANTRNTENIAKEFNREFQVMSSIAAHPNILRLLAACTQPPHLALVTEFCDGGSLYTMLHTPPLAPLPWAVLAPLCIGIARGMAHLHACNVLHRDLKSANVLLDRAGGVKICDFGLSRLCEGVPVMTGGLGTHAWMAPEVLACQDYSEKADVYSFGITLWECLTRKLPYSDMIVFMAATKVLYHGLRPELPKGIDPKLAILVKECWAPVPDQRPSFVEIEVRLAALPTC